MAKRGMTPSTLQAEALEVYRMHVAFYRLKRGGHPSYQALWCMAQVLDCYMEDLLETDA